MAWIVGARGRRRVEAEVAIARGKASFRGGIRQGREEEDVAGEEVKVIAYERRR